MSPSDKYSSLNLRNMILGQEVSFFILGSSILHPAMYTISSRVKLHTTAKDMYGLLAGFLVGGSEGSPRELLDLLVQSILACGFVQQILIVRH